MAPVDSTALLTDHYELTMLQATLAGGTADRRAVFEMFPRRLPDGRRYGVVAGVGRALDAIEQFSFDADVIDVLEQHGVVDAQTREWLARHRVSRGGWGYPAGVSHFPHPPLV